MDESLSIYMIRIKDSSYYTHAQFFSEFQTWVQFSLEGEIISRGVIMRCTEEVITFTAFLCH